MIPGHNPVLYVEELRRLPLLARRAGAPGSVFVYRSAGGRLSAPKGGYTAGELWWRGPYVVYEVDVRPSPVLLDVEVPTGPARVVAVRASGTMRVVDPVALVHHRVTDPRAACAGALGDELGRRLGRTSGEAVVARLHGVWPGRLTLACGVELTDLQVSYVSTVIDAAQRQLLHQLLETGALDRPPADEDTAALAAAAVRRDRDLLDAAVSALDPAAGIAAEDRAAALHAAVTRFGRIVDVLGAQLSPDDSGPPG
ncbi:hypothetical protein [Dactylosporangium sp. NPDC005555]|uniref:hypothetical protein n=1 Tax=Dactylosporangium sp. NPDC005555 TaxID=3154889 RepID=UPI0033BC1FF1